MFLFVPRDLFLEITRCFLSVLQKMKIVFFSLTFQERISAKICFHLLIQVNIMIKPRSLEIYGAAV